MAKSKAAKEADKLIKKQVDQIKREQSRERDRVRLNNAKLGDSYRQTKADLSLIGSSTKGVLNNLSGNINNANSALKTKTANNNASILSRLDAITQQNSGQAQDEMSRLGISGVGTQGLQDNASLIRSIVNQQGQNVLQGQGMEDATSRFANRSLLKMNTGSEKEHYRQAVNERNHLKDQNLEKFDEYKTKAGHAIKDAQRKRNDLIEQFKAQQRSFSSYGRGGGFARRSYGGGSYRRSFTPYGRSTNTYARSVGGTATGATKGAGFTDMSQAAKNNLWNLQVASSKRKNAVRNVSKGASSILKSLKAW